MSLNVYKVIRGTLAAVGFEPDGDSIRFIADDPKHYQDLYRSYKIAPSKKDGSVQLRLEGIDAPETHYGVLAQPYGETARTEFLKLAGFNSVTFDANGKKAVQSDPPTLKVAILTRAADTHGRPIAYIVADQAYGAADGSTSTVGDALLQDTVNFKMVANGHAYALAYSSAPAAHRELFRAAAKSARASNLGLWPQDETESFKLTDQDSIGVDGALIFPKLFRRASDFLKQAQQASAGYDIFDWLSENPSENDQLFLDGASAATDSGRRVEMHLSDILEQRNSRIQVTADILDVVFLEK